MIGKYIKRKIFLKASKKLKKLSDKFLKKALKINDEIASFETREWTSAHADIQHINEKVLKNDGKKRVLVLELNDFHGAVYPNFVIYFNKLGYEVDVLQTFGNNVKMECMCRVPKSIFRMYTGIVFDIYKFLNREEISQHYDYIFYHTTFTGEKQSVFSVLKGIPSGKYGAFLLEHNPIPNIEVFHEKYFIEQEMLFTLGGQENTRKVSCTQMGDVKVKHNLNKAINFLLVGAITKDNKDFEKLFNGIHYLIEKGFKNFYVTIVGPGNINVPEDIAPFVHLKGFLTYPAMYEVAEKSDFMLGMFSSDNEKHHKYLDNWYSGLRCLSLQFRKPIIIEKAFAEFYDVTSENGIVYEHFEKALLKAMTMSQDEYKNMVLATEKTCEELEQNSLETLKEMISYRESLYNKDS